MADENSPRELLEERKKIKERFSQWRKEPEFTPKSFLEGARERMRKGALGTIEMEALGKVGRVPLDQILSEAEAEVAKLKERGL